MGKKTRFLFLILLFAAGSLSGCGESGDDKTSASVSASEISTDITETEAESPEEDTETETVQEEENRAKVFVDFTLSGEDPLVKKIGFFDSALVPVTRRLKDLTFLEGLNADSYRIELGMGWGMSAFGRSIVMRDGELQLKLEELQSVLQMIKDCGTDICMAYSYTPYYLQTKMERRDQPKDLEAWQELCRLLAVWFKENGDLVKYHEVWNEPDCNGEFYTGTWEDYLELYRYASLGIREGDPDAMIGGPSTAFVQATGNRFYQFLKYTEENDLPLDFFSMHTYGPQFPERIDETRRNLLRAGERFLTTSIHLNELNTAAWPWPSGGICDQYQAAGEMLLCFMKLVEENDLETVNWAQFLESGVDSLGVIDVYGRTKATYHAFRIWSSMPEDRARFESVFISGMASFDENRASAVLVSESLKDKPVELILTNLPSDSGTISIYCIDETHSIYKDDPDELCCLETIEISGQDDYVWKGTLGAKGVIYAEFNAKEETEESSGPENADICRQYHCYYDRGGSSYAYFDEDSWTVRLSSGESGTLANVGVEAVFTGDTVLHVSSGFDAWDIEKLHLRVDYRTENSYTKSVTFGDGTFVPLWGTQTVSEGGIPASCLTGRELVIDLAEYAPEDWNRRAIITFWLEGDGPDTICKYYVK